MAPLRQEEAWGGAEVLIVASGYWCTEKEWEKGLGRCEIDRCLAVPLHLSEAHCSKEF